DVRRRGGDARRGLARARGGPCRAWGREVPRRRDRPHRPGGLRARAGRDLQRRARRRGRRAGRPRRRRPGRGGRAVPGGPAVRRLPGDAGQGEARPRLGRAAAHRPAQGHGAGRDRGGGTPGPREADRHRPRRGRRDPRRRRRGETHGRRRTPDAAGPARRPPAQGAGRRLDRRPAKRRRVGQAGQPGGRRGHDGPRRPPVRPHAGVRRRPALVYRPRHAGRQGHHEVRRARPGRGDRPGRGRRDLRPVRVPRERPRHVHESRPPARGDRLVGHRADRQQGRGATVDRRRPARARLEGGRVGTGGPHRPVGAARRRARRRRRVRIRQPAGRRRLARRDPHRPRARRQRPQRRRGGGDGDGRLPRRAQRRPRAVPARRAPAPAGV
ncbi:MAG: Myo-inositol 2-dehydrogenase, partial [uncultured Phycisphaerae bacterium]